MQLDEKYWNDRYLNDQAGWDIGSVSPALKQYFDTLSDKNIRILIPGAGNAYEAQYLKENGFKNVFVCDFAQEPLNNLKKRCPLFREEELIRSDFFQLDPAIGFDLVVEQTFFCAIDPKLRQDYYVKMHKLIRPGGRLMGLMFDCEFENSPPFGGNAEEYKTYLTSYFNTIKFEKCQNSIEPRKGRELFVLLERK